MEVFGIGPAELILILLLAFVVLGPEKLFATARELGRWTARLRRMAFELSSEVRTELAVPTQDVQETLTELRDLSGELRTQLHTSLSEARLAPPTPPSEANRSPAPALKTASAKTINQRPPQAKNKWLVKDEVSKQRE
jgi:sec-independent protein translocase protein TatB